MRSSTKPHLLIAVLAGLLATAPPADAGLFSRDIKVKFNRLVPSAINLGQIKRVAVISIANDSTERIANTLGAHLQATGRFEILERVQLKKIMQEHNLNMTGVVNDESAVEIGEVLGVEALIFGGLNSFEVNDEKVKKKLNIKTGEKTEYDKEGKARQVDIRKDIMAPATVRRGALDLTLKIVKVETGVILTQKNLAQQFEQVKISHVQATQVDLPSPADIERDLLEGALTEFVQHIMPYEVETELKWDKDIKVKDLEELVKNDFLEEAQEYIETITLPRALKNTKERKKRLKKDQAMAGVYYNLGLLAEVRGELKAAQEWYKKALLVSIQKPKKEVKKARNRIKELIASWDAYYGQVASDP